MGKSSSIPWGRHEIKIYPSQAGFEQAFLDIRELKNEPRSNSIGHHDPYLQLQPLQ